MVWAKRVIFGVMAVLVVLAGWLRFSPPDLLRVGTGYSAKIVCSNAQIAGRNPDTVLAVDVQAPGHWLLRTVSVDVDGSIGKADARMFGFVAESLAVMRTALGCALAPDGVLAETPNDALLRAGMKTILLSEDLAWPDGQRVAPSQDPQIDAILDDPAITGPGMRGIVVVHNGRIVAERYGDGFGPAVPLLGWSMTKTVTAAIIGTLQKAGRLGVGNVANLPQWMADDRSDITFADLLSMTSGLRWNEGYGTVSDVTRMLYLEGDMANFAASLPAEAAPGKMFNYSSGSSVLASRGWQNQVGPTEEALAWPYVNLFQPLGMASAVLEADAAGTYVGSSYLYANARDWARFGLLLAQRGAWQGQSILPAGFVDWMVTPVPASMAPWGKPEYGQGSVWLHGPSAGTPEGENPDAGFTLPADTFWMLGHDGQSIAVVPSRGLVVVRLGLTPSKLGYKPQALLEKLLAMLPQ
jgi:CubicO group peptidase (beta-lactamase class C family)